jgi:SAM-dependent methyltransferase
MKHTSEIFFVPAPLEGYDGQNYDGLQMRIARSNRFPFKALAIIAGLVSGVGLMLVAAFLRLCGKSRPDIPERKLGELYFHVPEMAVHKRIELRALSSFAALLKGCGLDVGCGNGYVGGLLKEMTGIDVLHGVDPVPGFANDVLSHGYGGFSAATASAIPLKACSFDCVFSICVMEHIRDLDGSLREALRLLKPGGALVLTTPSPEFRLSAMSARLWKFLGYREWAEAAARWRDKNSMQFHYATADQWRENLEAIGYEGVRVSPFFSRQQLLAYEVMNWCARVPELYYPDKLFVLCQKQRLLASGLIWSTSVLSSWVSSWSVADGCHTHWVISAKRPLADADHRAS